MSPFIYVLVHDFIIQVKNFNPATETTWGSKRVMKKHAVKKIAAYLFVFVFNVVLL